MKRTLILIIMISCCFQTLRAQGNDSESSQKERALELLNNKKYSESARLWRKLLDAQPRNPVYWLNLGICFYQLENYKSAIKSYNFVIRLKSPLAPAAELYRAKALIALGRHNEASSQLQALLTHRPPPGISSQATKDLQELKLIETAEEQALSLYQKHQWAQAEQMLRAFPENKLSLQGRELLGLSLYQQKKFLQSGKAFKELLHSAPLNSEQKETLSILERKSRRSEVETHAYWLNLDLSAGSTDNAYADGKSLSPVASSLIRSWIGLGYHFHADQEWSQKIGFIWQSEDDASATDLRSTSQTLQFSLLKQVSDLDFTVTPYFQNQTWDGVTASQKIGTSSKLIFSREASEYGIEADIYSQSPQSSSYDYLKGTVYSMKPLLAWWNDHLYGQVYWAFGSDGTQDITYSDGSLLPITQTFQGPGALLIWKPTETWLGVFRLNSIQHQFKNESLPEAKSRKDQELSSSLRIAYFPSRPFSIYQLTEWTNNSSTLGELDVRDKNYQVLTWTLGFTWDVF